MDKLRLPNINAQIKYDEGKQFIFDVIRKKYIQITPEEWVRQHFIHYLIESLDYPKSLINVEFGLKYNHLQKRSDIIIYNRNGHPLVLVECKAASIRLSQKVAEQAIMYNRIVAASYVILTNGIEHSCLQIKKAEGKIEYLAELPKFMDIHP